MNRTPEMAAAEAIEAFWLEVGKRHQTKVTGNSLEAIAALEKHAFDAAVSAMITYLQVRTIRLCAEGAEPQ
jgi:hypothetical protein